MNDPRFPLVTIKPRLSLVDPDFVRQVARVVEFGDRKHSPMGWLEQTIAARVDAMGRHVLALSDGEDNDPETGAPHSDHIGAQAMIVGFLLRHGVSGTARDGRRFAVPFAADSDALGESVQATLDAVVPARTLQGTLAKMVEEAGEARDARGDAHLAEELADVLICLLDAARIAGIDLPGATMSKLGVLAGRTYKEGRHVD